MAKARKTGQEDENGRARPASAPEDRSPVAAFERLKMPLAEAMTTQRAIRRLLPDPVDDEIIVRLVELAQKAPTGSNAQNWEFIVVKEREAKARIGRIYTQAWKVYGGIGRRLRSDEQTVRNMAAVEHQIENFADVPVVIVACLRGWRIPAMPQPGVWDATYYGSIFPSIQNLLLAARAVGLGAGIVTLPLWNTPGLRRILGIPRSVRPVCIVPIGWPVGRYGPTRRRPAGEIIHVDKYGNRPWAEEALEE